MANLNPHIGSTGPGHVSGKAVPPVSPETNTTDVINNIFHTTQSESQDHKNVGQKRSRGDDKTEVNTRDSKRIKLGQQSSLTDNIQTAQPLVSITTKPNIHKLEKSLTQSEENLTKALQELDHATENTSTPESGAKKPKTTYRSSHIYYLKNDVIEKIDKEINSYEKNTSLENIKENIKSIEKPIKVIAYLKLQQPILDEAKQKVVSNIIKELKKDAWNEITTLQEQMKKTTGDEKKKISNAIVRGKDLLTKGVTDLERLHELIDIDPNNSDKFDTVLRQTILILFSMKRDSSQINSSKVMHHFTTNFTFLKDNEKQVIKKIIQELNTIQWIDKSSSEYKAFCNTFSIEDNTINKEKDIKQKKTQDSFQYEKTKKPKELLKFIDKELTSLLTDCEKNRRPYDTEDLIWSKKDKYQDKDFFKNNSMNIEAAVCSDIAVFIQDRILSSSKKEAEVIIKSLIKKIASSTQDGNHNLASTLYSALTGSPVYRIINENYGFKKSTKKDLDSFKDFFQQQNLIEMYVTETEYSHPFLGACLNHLTRSEAGNKKNNQFNIDLQKQTLHNLTNPYFTHFRHSSANETPVTSRHNQIKSWLPKGQDPDAITASLYKRSLEKYPRKK